MPQRLDLILRNAPKGRVSKDASMALQFSHMPAQGSGELEWCSAPDVGLPNAEGHP